MRFLIDANLPRSLAERLRNLGHEVADVRDIGLGRAEDAVIADRARQDAAAIVTRDADFGDIRNYPPVDYAGIPVVDLPNDAHVNVILQIVEDFVRQLDLLQRLPGSLAILDAARVRFRRA
jgi:predicted nuclease of predicted toxin-antitoxin system